MKLYLTAIGHIGRDCSIKHLENGTSAINFSVACTEKYVDKFNQKHEKTTWIDCVLWRKIDKLKIADYLKKGVLIEVEGRPDSRGYASRNNTNQINSVITLRVDKLLLLSGGSSQNRTSESNSSDESTVYTAAQTDGDDLPF